jgi:hypothetical protein
LELIPQDAKVRNALIISRTNKKLNQLGQSCWIANLSGSTGEPYTLRDNKRPSGGTKDGDACIRKYSQQLGYQLPVCLRDKNPQNCNPSASVKRDVPPAIVERESNGSTVEDSASDLVDDALEKRQLGGCKPNTLLFARGTLETGTMGITVGPALSSALGSDWTAEGVKYDASMLGDYCVGLPGGAACKTQLESLVKRCPSTKVIVSGYSQGAMVARICTAFASDEAKKRVAVSLRSISTFVGSY